MRLCVLSARYPPDLSGVGDHSYFLAAWLAAQGHVVDVLTSTGPLDAALYPGHVNLRVHRVVTSWGPRGLTRLLHYARTARPEAALLQYAPHAFHRRGLTGAVNLAPLVLRAVRCRVVTNFHELYIPADGSLRRRAASRWQQGMVRLAARASDAVLASDTHWPQRLRDLGVTQPVTVVPVGSNIPLVGLDRDQRLRVRRALMGRDDGLLIGGFGSLHDHDFPGLLDALARIRETHPAMLLWIGGSPPANGLRRALHQEIEARNLTTGIVWTGFLPHPRVSELLGSCDAVALPFRHGVSSRRTTVAAALQHGLPVLTTAGDAPDPRFVHRANVYLVPAGDRTAVRDGLQELMRDRELRQQLAHGARSLYQTEFSWESIGRRVTPIIAGERTDRAA